jgi:hypothetical protein
MKFIILHEGTFKAETAVSWRKGGYSLFFSLEIDRYSEGDIP